MAKEPRANFPEDTAVPKQDETLKAESSTNTEPLAPPPRPDPSGAVSQTPDYFSGAHDGSLTYETNPFEHSFASGGASATTRTGGDQTPGGTKLPSVAALTSPSGLLGSGTTPSFWGSLRSGPLSPAMLSGPQKDDYFSDGHHLRGGFPTPNESSLRSGLTPGGGGSMFPEPSPNSQALFNQLGGAATPGTIDFQRTALTAAAAQRKQIPHSQPNVTSQPAELANGMDVKPQVAGPFDQHDANDAANGLFLLAQAQTNRNGGQVAGQYAMAPQMPVHAHPQPMMQMSGQQPGQSPTMGDDSTGNGDRRVSGMSAQSDDNDPANRPNTRGKGKRPSGAQANQAAGRRKAEEPPAKAQAAKKAKANNGHAMEPEPPSEDEQDMSKEEEYNHPNGKKMTDEEKRKNFLERNRQVHDSKPVTLDAVLTRVQGGCAEVQTTEEAMARKPATEGRDLQHRE